MKKLKFYKLYDWIIEEMGVSADAGLIAVIHSFSEMRKECQMSYSDFADVLKVSRRKAIDRIKRLAEDGYLTIQTRENENGKQANTYTINYAKFTTTPSDETVTTPSDETVTTPSDETVTTPSDETVTTLVTKPSLPTITEKLKENITERGENTHEKADTQREPKENHPAPLFGNESELVLSESELFYIRYKVDYTRPRPTNTHKHSAEHYIDLVTSREYPLARVLRFLRDDYYILTDEEAQQRKTEAEHDAELLAAYAQLANE